MSIASRIEAIEGHIGDVYDTLELGGSDLTNVDKNIVNINSELIDRYKDYLANGTNELWNNWDKATNTGVNEATINNTIKAKMLVAPKGDTQQFTTTGKNKLNYTNYVRAGKGTTTVINNGINVKNENSSSSGTTQTGFVIGDIQNYAGKTMTISARVKNNVSTAASEFTIRIKYGTSTDESSQTGIGQRGWENITGNMSTIWNYTATIPTGVTGTLYVWFLRYPTSGTWDVDFTDIQFEESPTATSYEPYTGGIASPNPDYPQTVNNVKGGNLFDTSKMAGTNNITVANDKLIMKGTTGFHATNTGTTLKDIADLEVGKTYILNFKTTYTGTNANSLYLSGVSEYWDKGRTKTITQQMLDGRFALYGTNDSEISEIQIVEGSEILSSYLPYNTVEVKVQNKNLFDKNNPNVYNGYFTPSSPIMTSNTNHRTIYVPIKPNTIYTIQKSNVGGDNCRFGIGTTTTIPTTGVSVSQVALNNSATTQTITTNQSAKYLVVWCYFTSNTSITENELYASIQIEQRSTASTYVAHQEQNYPISLGDIELCKIGEYQDYIYKENGNWYKYGAIGKVVLDGTENWIFSNSASTPTNRSIMYMFKALKNEDYLSNYFIKNSTGSNKLVLAPPETIYLSLDDSFTGIENTDTDSQKLIKLKTWLSTHNTEVYCPLVTPTITQITDTTLINQLNALEQAYSYNEQTNISQDGDLPFILDVTALVELS